MTPGTVVCHACSISTATAPRPAGGYRIGTHIALLTIISTAKNSQYSKLRISTANRGNKVFRILDFENLTEKTKGLNTRNVQLQKLPEQSEEYLTGEGIKVEIVSPTVGIVLSGKVPYVATVTGNKSVTGVDFILTEKKFARKNPLLTWPTATTTYGIPPRCRTGTAS